MVVTLSLAAAVVFGVADFLGGVATRRGSALSTAACSFLAGLLMVVLLLPVLPGELTGRALALGAAAGVAGGGSIALLFRGLARGPMSVVAPVTALAAAAVPVLAGVAAGERPTPLAVAGTLVALVAVVLVSRHTAPHAQATARTALTDSVLLALTAGTGFGVFFVLLEQAGAEAGLWPLVSARVAALALFAVTALAVGRSLVPTRVALPMVLATGVLDMAANVLYLLAIREGLLSLVAVIVALYPAITVLLARLMLGERLQPAQCWGLAASALSVTLIATA